MTSLETVVAICAHCGGDHRLTDKSYPLKSFTLNNIKINFYTKIHSLQSLKNSVTEYLIKLTHKIKGNQIF